MELEAEREELEGMLTSRELKVLRFKFNTKNIGGRGEEKEDWERGGSQVRLLITVVG